MKTFKITVLSAMLSFASAYAATVTVPNSFTAGTPAKAADVNANFTTLANAINSSAGDIAALQSAMATAGFNYRNTWSSATSYAKNDVVTNAGSSYVALRATTNNNPTIDVSNNGGNWGLIAQAGAAGATGPAGPTGPKGDAGAVGPTGIAGPIGPKGDTGNQGLQGIQGPQGVKGDTGSQGPQGLQGPKGDTGATGPGALMVYDSTGKVVGQYETVNVYPEILSAVIINDSGGVFQIGLNATVFASAGVNGVGSLLYYYASTDCSGEGFLEASSNAYINQRLIIPWAEYDGLNALIPTGSLLNFFAGSSKSSDGCTTFNQPYYATLTRINRKFDLSVFTPPFSVH